MATINNEAIDSLIAAIESLLPDVGDPALQPVVIINPARIVPTGLGGVVSFNEDPIGEILGRRVEAKVVLIIKARDILPLKNKMNEINRAFLGVERKTLLELGILDITLDEIGSISTEGQGSNRIAEQNLTFNVLYEFLKRPEEPEDLIREIPINLNVN